MNRRLSRALPKNLQQAYRDGISFLSRRAPRHPNPDPTLGSSFLHEIGINFLLKTLKNVRVAKEAGDMDQQIVIKGRDFLGMALENFQIILQMACIVH